MNGKVYLILFSVYASICLNNYCNFSYDLGAIVNSCTMQLVKQSQQTQITPSWKIIEIKSAELKKYETLLIPFPIIEHEIDNNFLTKRSRKLA